MTTNNHGFKTCTYCGSDTVNRRCPLCPTQPGTVASLVAASGADSEVSMARVSTLLAKIDEAKTRLGSFADLFQMTGSDLAGKIEAVGKSIVSALAL
jgi:hypothetical protein